MNLCYIKCLMYTKNNNVKLKRDIDGKIILFSHSQIIFILIVLTAVLESLQLSMKKKLIIY